MPRPDPDAYREAQVAARQLLGEMREESARRIQQTLRRYAENVRSGLTEELGDLSADALARRQALERASEINSAAARQLMDETSTAIGEQRNVTFNETLGIWDDAGTAAAESAGVDAAALGAVRPPPVTMLGAFEASGRAESWQTLLRGHIDDAASEANRIVRMGMTEGIAPDELGRRLRRYVEGSEEFDDLFSEVETMTGDVAKLDLREVPKELRKEAGQIRYKADRIAMSEIRNARHEAEIQHMIRDPLIRAVKWTLSPVHDHTDECDLLADADWYGLGRGVYPVGRVPAPPHPFDQCGNRSLGRPSEQMDQPKPDPDRRLDASQADASGFDDLTENAAERARERAEEAIQIGESVTQEALRSAAA